MRFTSIREIFSIPKLPFTKRSQSRIFFIKPDKSILVSTKGDLVEEGNMDTVVNKIKDTHNPLLLLSAPHLFSYVHKTIPLTKKDLLRADEQVFQPSRFPTENRIVESFDLGTEKAITIHSHLSDAGMKLIDKLKRAKLNFAWEPAIPFLLRNLFNHHEALFSKCSSVTVLLFQEILNIEFPSTDKPEIRHFFSIWPDLPQKDQIEKMKSALKTSDIKEPNLLIDLNSPNNQPDDIGSLFSAARLKNGIKHLKRKSGKRRKSLKALFSPITILALISLIVVTLSVTSQYRLMQLKQQRQDLIIEVAQLKQISGELQSLAENERSLAKAVAMKEAFDTYQINPAQIVNSIIKTLPETTWIKLLNIAHDEISLELYDTKGRNYSTILNRLSKEIGPAQLAGNSKEELGETTAFYYKIRIKKQ